MVGLEGKPEMVATVAMEGWLYLKHGVRAINNALSVLKMIKIRIVMKRDVVRTDKGPNLHRTINHQVQWSYLATHPTIEGYSENWTR